MLLKHNHPKSKALQIYGTCPVCDIYYHQVIADAKLTQQEHKSFNTLRR